MRRPTCQVPTRFGDHPPPDFVDQACILGDGNEDIGRNPSSDGMLPAQQCLIAAGDTGSEVGDRLKGQAKAAV